MKTYEFTFVVDHRLSEDEVDGLFDRADDVTPEREQARTLLGFDRQATSLAEALVSALRDVESAGLIVGSVRSEDLVTLKEIAARTRRSYESVRLLAAGKRGPGGFPGPMSLSLIHISEPTRQAEISYAVFCLKKKKKTILSKKHKKT